MLGDRSEKIICARVEHGYVRSRAGGDDADDFAADDLFAGAGLLHLVADGDLESGADEARDVAVSGVIGNAAHRNRLALFAIARGQRNLQFARGQQRVFVEEFVEIAEAEEQQRVRVARFDRVVLLHQGRSEEHTSELQSHLNLVCRLLLEKKKKTNCRRPQRSAAQFGRPTYQDPSIRVAYKPLGSRRPRPLTPIITYFPQTSDRAARCLAP